MSPAVDTYSVGFYLLIPLQHLDRCIVCDQVVLCFNYIPHKVNLLDALQQLQQLNLSEA